MSEERLQIVKTLRDAVVIIDFLVNNAVTPTLQKMWGKDAKSPGWEEALVSIKDLCAYLTPYEKRVLMATCTYLDVHPKTDLTIEYVVMYLRRASESDQLDVYAKKSKVIL